MSLSNDVVNLPSGIEEDFELSPVLRQVLSALDRFELLWQEVVNDVWICLLYTSDAADE